MRKPIHFSLEEFLTSSTARQKSIENLPSWTVIEHLNELALFLDELREAWGSGIKINSGFRNDKLNQKVGGVMNSIHKIGFAADVYPVNGKWEEFKRFVKNWIKDKDFDQCIIEKKGKSEWIHIGLYNNSGQQRHNIFSLVV